MPKLTLKRNMSGQRVFLFIPDKTSTDGSGLTGLTNASYPSGTVRYVRPGETSVAVGALVSMAVTAGYTSNGFVEVDAANMPGVYRYDIPDAVFATNFANNVVIHFNSVGNAAQTILEFQLLNSSEPTGRPPVDADVWDKINWLFMQATEENVDDEVNQQFKNSSGTVVGTAPVSVSGTVFTRGRVT